MASYLQQVQGWWRQRVKNVPTPFFASANTGLSPAHAGAGEALISAVFIRGTRHYLFADQKSRDRFLTKFRKQYNAQAVGKDPCP